MVTTGCAPEGLPARTGPERCEAAVGDARGIRRRLLDNARGRLGPSTPPPIRREAAAILRAAECSPGQIDTVFGVTGATLAYALWDIQPGSAVPDPVGAIGELACQAEKAQLELGIAHEQLGPGTRPVIRRQAAGILRLAGFSFEQIGTAFAVTGAAISHDLRGRRC